MNGFSIWHWLIALLIVALVIGVPRIGSIPPVSALLFSAQPAETGGEAEYIDDSLPRKHGLWIWLGALMLVCGIAFLVDTVMKWLANRIQ